jgi:TfoX/Sxy family transcriptional regulator of competence genes
VAWSRIQQTEWQNTSQGKMQLKSTENADTEQNQSGNAEYVTQKRPERHYVQKTSEMILYKKNIFKNWQFSSILH